MKRYTLLLLCLSLFFIALFGVPVSADDSQTLRVGLYGNSPKIFTDENGDAAGFWPDIIAYIAAEEGWEIEYVKGTWAQCLDRLANDEIDIMPDVAYTEERAALYDFSTEVVYVSWSRVYTREWADIESILDLEGKNIAVLRGSVNVEGPDGIKVLASEFDVDCTFIEADSYTRVFELVESGEADAGVASKDFGYQHKAEFGIVETAIIFQPSSLYFAFTRDSTLTPYLIERIDSRVAELKADKDSIYYQSLRDWIGIEPAEKAVIPGWLKWALIGVGGLALLLGGGGLILRSQVRARTKALTEEVNQRQHAEEKLRESEELLNDVGGIAKVGGWEMDLITRKAKWTKATYDIVEIDYGDPIPGPDEHVEYYLPKYRPLVASAMEKLIEDDIPLDFEAELRTAKGNIIWCRAVGKAIRENGKCVKVRGIFQDITESKKAGQLQRGENYVLTLLGQGAELSEILDAIVRLGEQNDPSIKGSVLLCDPSKPGEMLLQASGPSLPGGYKALLEAGVPIGPKSGSCGTAAYRKERVVIPDIAQSPLFKPFPDVVKQTVKDNLLAVWSQPIIASNGELLGTIANYSNRVGEPSDDNLVVLEWSARMAAIAIERRRAEEALRESEEFQSSLLANSPIPINVINADSSVRYVNPAMVKLTGYSAEELTGEKAPYSYWPRENHAKIMKGHNKAMRQGGERMLELFQKKNGEKFWVEITSVVMKKDGKFQYLLTNWVDVTERKLAEEALRESEEKYKTLTEDAPIGIYFNDFKGTFLYGNKKAQEITGYKREDILGKSFVKLKLLSPKEIAKALKLLALNKLGKATGPDRFVLNRRDGTKSIVEIRTRITTVGGKKVVLGMVEDITERKQAEDALRESEAFQSGLLSNSPNPINVINPDGSVRYVNPAMVKLTGFSTEELIGQKPPYLYWAKEDRAENLKGLNRALRQGGKGVPKHYRKKNGERFWVEITSTPVKKGGKLRYLLANWVDVTERKLAAEKLRDEATRHRILIDESSDGIIILDEQGKVYEANRRFAEMLGYTLEEIRELHVWDWDIQFKREQIEEMAASVGPEGARFESRHRRKDGTIFDVELSNNGAVYEGQKLIFCVVRDITERKQAAATLKESEEKYKTLVEANSDIIWEVDREARFTFVSSRIKEIMGYEVDELVGKMRTLDLVPEADFQKWLKRFKDINAKHKPFSGIEMTQLHKDGTPIIFETSGIPLFDSAGEFKGYIGINKDVTERRNMQEQLVITDRLASVGELAAGIAHELNNPLTGVIGFSQLMMDKEMPEDIKEDVEVVFNEAQRASQVVKNLLTFARKHAAAKERVDINEIISKVLELRAYEMNLENIKVDARLDPELPEIMADYFQLQQVFLNIVINAEYFMKESHQRGKLTITTAMVDNRVKASFADDGPGIAKQAQGHLFDPFFTTKEVGKGTGLGLSICHGIIAEHGGRIYVESELGKGATFIVELPVGAAEKKGGVA